MRFFLLTLAVLLLTSCAIETTYRVSVNAGDTDRTYTPVRVELGLPVTAEKTPVCVSNEEANIRTPGQIQRINDERAYVWWTIDELPANTSRTYTIDVGYECNGPAFTWSENGDSTTTLTLGEQTVLSYVHPDYDINNKEATLKPFHHVYHPGTKQRITKGPGGLYTHHRGIFFGYSNTQIGDNSYHTWGIDDEGGHLQHTRILNSLSGPVVGAHTVEINWEHPDGEAFAREQRTLRVFSQPDNNLLIELETTLNAVDDTVVLGGDRQHAGVQFRAAQWVAEHRDQTRFLRPAEWSHLPRDQEHNAENYQDLPWNAIQFSIQQQPYTVAYLTDPGNPNPAKFSERAYGRFGEFFPYELTPENPLHARYRWAVRADTSVTREQINDLYQDLANPPKITVLED